MKVLCGRCLGEYDLTVRYKLKEPIAEDHPLPPGFRFTAAIGPYVMCPKCAEEGSRWFEENGHAE